VAQAVPERTRRDQTVEDCIVSSGPAIALISLMGSLQDGRYVLSVWNTPPFALIAAPVALYLWHKTAPPPLPPPAGTAVFITLIVTNRQSWPAIFTDLVPLVLIPLREACHAIRRNGKGTR
jgi:hypothetical protein